MTVLSDDLEETAMQALHIQSNCYVSCSHSEGWGMGAFDSATHGNPVIMTGYGGQCDFLEPESSYLLDYKLVAVDDSTNVISYTKDQMWAEPDLQQASRYMRFVFEHRQHAAEKGAALRENILRNFNADIVSDRLLQVLTSHAST